MLSSLKKVVVLIVLFLTLLLIIFVINQTSQLVNLAGGLHPLFGQIVLISLLIIYALILFVPLFTILHRPEAMFPPPDLESAAYRDYLIKLARRLAKNPRLKESEAIDPADPLSLQEALSKLDREAETEVKNAASTVFIMTAISQYGALDALIVTIAQLRMIWRVTLIYNQRPSLRDLIYLYSNVFATAFLATKLENLDLLEDQLEPVIASIMGSSLSSLTPAFSTAANVITNAVIQGSANAFLTLRVGVITKNYCSSLVRPEKSSLRRLAALQAAALLAKVLGESTYSVTRAVIRATAKTGKRPFRYGHDLVVQTSHKTWETGKASYRKGGTMVRDIRDVVKSGALKIKRFFSKPSDPE